MPASRLTGPSMLALVGDRTGPTLWRVLQPITALEKAGYPCGWDLTHNALIGQIAPHFDGYLLPRMQRTFGRLDWLANGVLFALYHLHVPWVIPATFADSLILAYPARRYRSAWLPIIVHSSQVIFIGLLVLTYVI